MDSEEMSSKTDSNIEDDTIVSNANYNDKTYKDDEDSILETLSKSEPIEKSTEVIKTKNFFPENDKSKVGKGEVPLDNGESEFSTAVNGFTACTNYTADGNVSVDSSSHDTEKFEINSSESKEEINEKLQLNHEEICIDDDTICGIGCFKPKWIQKYATPKVYLVLYSILGVIQGAYSSYFTSVVTTLEKRYALNSKTIASVRLVEEITPIFLGLLFGYVGGKTHRPRMVAIGMFMSAVCCIITTFPFIIYGPVKHLSIQGMKNETINEVCDELKIDDCDSSKRPATMSVVGILIIAIFIKGFSGPVFYIVGLSYMDDSAKKKNTPLYLATVITLRYLGPLLGYLMAFIFLKFYENPVEDPGYGPEDPRWIGAWWIGFILQGVVMVICTLPIAIFPRRLPNHKRVCKDSSAKEESWKEFFSGMLDALKRLRKNPIYTFMVINTVLTIFGHFGPAFMLPKYMENQFKLSAADASLFSGATIVGCMMVATMFGGFLIWKYKPSAKILFIGMLVSEICMCVGYLILMIPGCQPTDMLNFGQNDQGIILSGQCNQNCACSKTAFSPFCGQDGKTTYFSPCYAGCKQQMTSFAPKKEKKAFGNCSCVADELGLMAGTVIEGFCIDESCWTQKLAYLCILLFLTFISRTFSVAHTLILLRSVHPSDKSVALGGLEQLCCLFGFLPSSITYGSIADSSCLVWDEACDQTGNCWFYDMAKFKFLLHGVASVFCFLSVCCIITLYYFHARIRSLYEEEDEAEEHESIKLDTVSGPVTKL